MRTRRGWLGTIKKRTLGFKHTVHCPWILLANILYTLMQKAGFGYNLNALGKSPFIIFQNPLRNDWHRQNRNNVRSALRGRGHEEEESPGQGRQRRCHQWPGGPLPRGGVLRRRVRSRKIRILGRGHQGSEVQLSAEIVLGCHQGPKIEWEFPQTAR